jgi:hypothetical protein
MEDYKIIDMWFGGKGAEDMGQLVCTLMSNVHLDRVHRYDSLV